MPFSGNKITVEQLRGLPLILSHYSHQRLSECCKPYGFEPQLLCYMSKVRARLIWACEGIGVSLVPLGGMEQSSAIPPYVRCLELDEPSLMMQAALVRKKDVYLHAAVSYFLEEFTTLHQQMTSAPVLPQVGVVPSPAM